MSLEQLFAALLGQLHDHAAKIATGAVLMGLGWFFGRRRARAEWKRREFFSRLNISLNSIENGKLLIRTLVEKNCDDVFLNAVATSTVVAAARKTTAKNPLLPLPAGDYWFYLNPILNELSERFSEGHLRRDMGLPVRIERYLICLTREVAGDIRTQKVRAMVVRKALLQQLPAEPPEFERPHHLNRWTTLQLLAAEYAARPEQFIELELAL